MRPSDPFFYLFALLALGLARACVCSQHLLRATLYLAGVLFCGAAFYVILDAEFLAGIQLLVYIGGISVLLIFAIMLTRGPDLLKDRPSPLRRNLALALSLSFMGLCSFLVLRTDWPAALPAEPHENPVRDMGVRLLNPGEGGLLLPFEVISVLLLCVAIAAIYLARPGSGEERPLS